MPPGKITMLALAAIGGLIISQAYEAGYRDGGKRLTASDLPVDAVEAESGPNSDTETED